MEWQAEKTALCIMLHCFWAHDCLYGLAVQGLVIPWALGQLGRSFQLFPNTSGLTTTAWHLVVKSLFALLSQLPQSPHTRPWKSRVPYIMLFNLKHWNKASLIFLAEIAVTIKPNSLLTSCGVTLYCGLSLMNKLVFLSHIRMSPLLASITR